MKYIDCSPVPHKGQKFARENFTGFGADLENIRAEIYSPNDDGKWVWSSFFGKPNDGYYQFGVTMDALAKYAYLGEMYGGPCLRVVDKNGVCIWVNDNARRKHFRTTKGKVVA